MLQFGTTPLMAAAERGNVDIVSLLLLKDADSEATDMVYTV